MPPPPQLPAESEEWTNFLLSGPSDDPTITRNGDGVREESWGECQMQREIIGKDLNHNLILLKITSDMLISGYVPH
jgi:hypothetical protein